MKNISNHPSIIYTNDIADICKPLTHLNISYFSHVHVDNKQGFSAICNNPGFMEHYIKSKYYNADIHLANSNTFTDFVIWDTIERTGRSAQMGVEALAHGVDHTFTIIQKNKHGSDYFHFSTNLPDKSFNQVYLSNYDLLSLFILSFKEKIENSKDLKRSYDLIYKIDKDAEGYLIKDDASLIDLEDKRKRFIDSLDINLHASQNSHKLLLPNNNFEEITIQNISFSKRENQCLYYTVRGQTAKKIARILGLSQRTIEEYLTNIKKKLGVSTKSEIIEKVVRMGT